MEIYIQEIGSFQFLASMTQEQRARVIQMAGMFPTFFTEGNTVEKRKDSLLCVVPTAHEERRALS